VITTQVGDLLPWPKRWLVNFVIKHVKKMVPAWQIDGAIDLSRRARTRHGGAPHAGRSQREDIAFLQYTGGTTGVAKGAMLTHRNILANLEQTGVWISGSFKEGKRNRHRAAADVPHLLPDLDAVVHEVGQPDRADHQSARHAGAGQGTREAGSSRS
jgi:acyl-CoA synthetase (AMP-forming)/AMP-acid ligase II